MPSVCLYFHVHQPRRVKRYRVFDIGNDANYFNDASESDLNNKKIIQKVAKKCYLPANAVLLELLKKYPDFKVSFSLSGIFLEQLEEQSPEALESFQKLAATGRAEIVAETYYHSLAFLYSRDEFRHQVEMHRKKVWELFRATPRVFRNTELAYNNELGVAAEAMGYRGILAEGWDAILGWRSPNFLYRPKGAKNIKLLLKNYKLSDDIAFRFSSRDWEGWPLTAEKFAHWVSRANGNGEVVNLFMDYETFGEHQWEETGIFNFLRALPGEIYRHPDNDFVTVSEAVARYPDRGEVDMHHIVSWADTERDLSAWLGNSMQTEAARALYEMEMKVLATRNPEIIRDWRRLQTSDHLYYMCTKWFNDGDVHAYFSPYDSPYDAFVSYMNVLNDLKLRAGGEK